MNMVLKCLPRRDALCAAGMMESWIICESGDLNLVIPKESTIRFQREFCFPPFFLVVFAYIDRGFI